MGQNKECGFYFGCSGKPLEDFKPGEKIPLTLQKDGSGCLVEQGLEAEKNSKDVVADVLARVGNSRVVPMEMVRSLELSQG